MTDYARSGRKRISNLSASISAQGLGDMKRLKIGGDDEKQVASATLCQHPDFQSLLKKTLSGASAEAMTRLSRSTDYTKPFSSISDRA